MKREILVLVGVALLIWILISITLHNPREQAGQPPALATATPEIESMTPMERSCYGMWLKYGDTAISNLTIQQNQGIQYCETLGLFHDRK